MARYLSGSYRSRRRRNRRSIRIILAFVIVVALTACIYGYHPFGKNEDETSATLVETNVGNETDSLVVMPPKSEPEPKLSEIVAEPTSEPNPKVDDLIAEAMALINGKPARIIEARDRLNEVLPTQQSRQQREVVKEQLSKLADKWLFSRTIYRQDGLCGSYKVKPGELLSTIGKQHKVPYEILMQINKIRSDKALRAGETIKVIHGPFHARIYRSTFTMDLYLQNTFVKSFPVGLGQPGMETPTGLWRVHPKGKMEKPTWYDKVANKTYHPENPDYPLGSRWIGLEGIKGNAKDRTGFAIHGTKKPEEIGTAGSRGCIRLDNGDAILIYNLLMPSYSLVEIVE